MLLSDCVLSEDVLAPVPARWAPALSLLLATTAPHLPSSGLGSGGTECKRNSRRSRRGTELQYQFGSSAFLFFLPQRGGAWFWELRRAETPPALCSLRKTSALRPPPLPPPPLTHAAHSTHYRLCAASAPGGFVMPSSSFWATYLCYLSDGRRHFFLTNFQHTLWMYGRLVRVCRAVLESCTGRSLQLVRRDQWIKEAASESRSEFCTSSALQQMFLSEGCELWNDFTSQPGDAPVWCLNLPPTHHPHGLAPPWKHGGWDVLYFFEGGDLYDKAQFRGLIS